MEVGHRGVTGFNISCKNSQSVGDKPDDDDDGCQLRKGFFQKEDIDLIK